MSNYPSNQPPPYFRPPPKSQPGVSPVLKFVIGGGLAAVLICIVVVVGYLSSPGAIGSSPSTNSSPSTDRNSPPNAQRPKVTLNQYNQLKEGMAYTEVVKILGMEGKIAHQKQTVRDTFKSYGWKLEGNRFTYIDITFKNDQLLSKTQYGLE
jgi:hypothetical protein